MVLIAAGFAAVHRAAVGLVLHCLRTGRLDEARSRYTALVRRDPAELPHDMVRTWTLTQLALAAIAFDDAPTAERLHAALEPLAGRFAVVAGGVICSGAVDHYLGLLDTCRGRASAADAHFERAIALHASAGAPALLATTRLALAAIDTRTRDERTALLDAAAAGAEAMGLSRLTAEITRTRGLLDTRAAGPPVLTREGGLWVVAWQGRVARVPHGKGMGYLAALPGAVGRERGALDLARAAADDGCVCGRAVPTGLRSDIAGPPQPVADQRALAAYRTRLADLRLDLDDARADHDLERAATIEAEIDFLARELGGALGRTGKRRALPTDSERARISVTRAIRAAIARITDADPHIGGHLAAAVSTGTYCRYDPHRPERDRGDPPPP